MLGYEDQSVVVATRIWRLLIQSRDPRAVRAKDINIISYADLLRVVPSKNDPGVVGGVRRLFAGIGNVGNTGIEPGSIIAE